MKKLLLTLLLSLSIIGSSETLPVNKHIWLRPNVPISKNKETKEFLEWFSKKSHAYILGIEWDKDENITNITLNACGEMDKEVLEVFLNLKHLKNLNGAIIPSKKIELTHLRKLLQEFPKIHIIYTHKKITLQEFQNLKKEFPESSYKLLY